jgi:arylsulfatase A
MGKQPNILLINCDDLGYGDLGCYGSTRNRTPVIDRMAADGIRLTDFYMASPVCSPSRGAMMTGCYPPRIGFGDFDGQWVLFPGQGLGLHPQERTVASLLKDAGYRTMLVGKWHCGDQLAFLPTRHGFEQYYGLPYSNDMGRQGGRTTYPPLPLMLDEEVLEAQPDQRSLTERYVEQAVRFMRNNRENPFFLYLAHMHVHLPHYAPERFERESLNGEYGAAVECVDWATGMLLHELKQLGLEEDTLVVFTSDNGSRGDRGGSNAPLCGNKGTTWEGGQRVPCIFRWPGKIQAGQVANGMVSSLDFYKTFARLAKAEVPQDRTIDGFDLVPMLLEGEDSPRSTFFYYFRNQLEAVREGRWKLHVHKGDTPLLALYDLEQDCAEQHDLLSEQPEVVERLQGLLDACRKDMGDTLTGLQGAHVRPAGRVENPDTLTHFDPCHPYFLAMYDKGDAG